MFSFFLSIAEGGTPAEELSFPAALLSFFAVLSFRYWQTISVDR
jgi:hypothetical protein